MVITDAPLCDFDGDGVCSISDEQIFQNAIGTCRREDGYNIVFDIDGSGCIDEVDQNYLFVKRVDVSQWEIHQTKPTMD